MNETRHKPSRQPSVTWMAAARRGLSDSLCSQVDRELGNAFQLENSFDANVGSLPTTAATEAGDGSDGAIPHGPTASALSLTNSPTQIIVKQRFHGYVTAPEAKLILAVEVQSPDGVRSSVVKVGDANQVGGDVEGWKSCAGKRGLNSRLFIAPILRNVGLERVAVIYPDVYQYYYDNGNDDQPQELDKIVENSITRNIPTHTSVQRVLTQVYTEAYRCLHRFAEESTSHEAIEYALKQTLRLEKPDSVMLRWQEDEFMKLRRGAAWLTCGHRKPDSNKRPEYIDPVDYLQWAMKTGSYPVLLVGPAHGDLHGRNIIAGSVRGEAEWPAVFDFDKMLPNNIVAWDFAKLEIELKCRLFPKILELDSDRTQIREWLGMPPRTPLPVSIRLSGDEQRVQQRAEQMEIMFAIERLLLDWTRQLSTRSRAVRAETIFDPEIPTESPLGRALQIIFRIRREAAIHLGFDRQGRETCWVDEYLFALATYGIGTIKWHSSSEFLAWALLSSGVASAALTQFPWPPTADEPPSVEDSPSYLHLLPYADACWKKKQHSEPLATLRLGMVRFPYAVALRQQLALSLAQSPAIEDEQAARNEIQEFVQLACVFRDHETLCRLGRVYKDRADRLFDGSSSLHEVISGKLPSYQHYRSALKHYQTAYEVSDDYYPGVNAATLAMLVGDDELKEDLANQVLEICGGFGTDRDDQTWILASEGEASLLVGKTKQAVNFYSGSLDRIGVTEVGTIQSIYDQLCRLHWAIGIDAVQPVVEMLDQQGRLSGLAPGPFGNCGRAVVKHEEDSID